jgi:PAS domain S-box-containing protein
MTPLAPLDLHRSPIARLADPVLAFDTTGVIVYANPAFEELYGWEADELVGRPTKVLIPKQYQRQQRVDLSGEGVLLHKTGTVVPVERRVTPLETSAGLIILALIVDISERKRGEQALRDRIADLEGELAELRRQH